MIVVVRLPLRLRDQEGLLAEVDRASKRRGPQSGSQRHVDLAPGLDELHERALEGRRAPAPLGDAATPAVGATLPLAIERSHAVDAAAPGVEEQPSVIGAINALGRPYPRARPRVTHRVRKERRLTATTLSRRGSVTSRAGAPDVPLAYVLMGTCESRVGSSARRW
jgi:hypothetical protein